MSEHFLHQLFDRYPRLKEVAFTFCDKDVYSVETTPAGEVEVLYFYRREDFENAVIALAYKLERRPIPASMGALFLSGLVDRVAMCKTSIVILSRGGYSAIPSSAVGLEEEEWLDKSFVIRRDHELAHFVQRKLFPENKDALRDEIKADMVGLISAFGEYKPDFAKLFLGTEGDSYREGGRLQNYVNETANINDLMLFTNQYIDTLTLHTINRSDAFNCLIEIEELEKQ